MSLISSSKYTIINGTHPILYYSRIKDAIPEFIILVPPNIVRDDNEAISERNSIAILTHLCSKNLCKLDMKLTLKKFDEPNGNDEEENDEFNKYKFVFLFYFNSIRRLISIN